MKDNKSVVVMPEHLERQRVNVAEFARSQDMKEPPKLRRSLTRKSIEKTDNLRTSKSPGRRRLSSSRDLVQEVYDRMGVNYVRGQSSSGIYDSNGSFSATSEISKLSNPLSSNVSRATAVPNRSFQNLSVETGNDGKDEDFHGPKSCRSARSVKSLMSAFGGGKSVKSTKSVASRDSFQAPGFVDTTLDDRVGGNIDCRDDGDMDGTMSVISLESNWTRGKQKLSEEEDKLQVSRNSDFRGRRSPFQNPTSKAVVALPKHQNIAEAVTKPLSGISTGNEAMDKVIERMIEAKIVELTASFEEKFRVLEEETNRRLEKMEKELKESSKGKDKPTYPYRNFRL